MKFLRILSVLAVALCIAGSVYAETQSVKVSGDLTVRGLFRNAYDYRGSINEPTGTRTNVGNRTAQAWWMSDTELQVEADLTDNVQTVIRLLNQRDWNVTNKNVLQGTTLATNGLGGYDVDASEFNVNLDLAYVTLKDFIYSPLTLTIGRQDLWFGKGFIVGLNQQNPADSAATNAAWLGTSRGLAAPEYTSLNAFDAIKAVLDYDPWTITGIYSNIKTNAIQADDTVNLWGVNVGYKFDVYKAEAEGYWFYKQDDQVEIWAPIKGSNDVHNLGVRGSLDPIDTITVWGEGAYQFGEFIGSRNQMNSRDRSAFALDFGGESRYFVDRYAWKPKFGVEYILYSGQEPEESPAQNTGAYKGWDGMYRGKFDSAIREFVGKFYASWDYPQRADYLISSPDASFTNQHQIVVRGVVQPVESLTVSANYNIFWTYVPYLYSTKNTIAVGGPGLPGVPERPDGLIGQEVDLQANWDYTEDVSFGLLCGWFVPDSQIYKGADKAATDIVGTVKVSF